MAGALMTDPLWRKGLKLDRPSPNLYAMATKLDDGRSSAKELSRVVGDGWTGRFELVIGWTAGWALDGGLLAKGFPRRPCGAWPPSCWSTPTVARPPKQAVRLADRFAELGITWSEEPVSSDDLSGLRAIRNRIGPEMAVGEYGYDVAYFQAMWRVGRGRRPAAPT
jgi:hypothetical protein